MEELVNNELFPLVVILGIAALISILGLFRVMFELVSFKYKCQQCELKLKMVKDELDSILKEVE